jgi:hypothetical protein
MTTTITDLDDFKALDPFFRPWRSSTRSDGRHIDAG